MEKPLARKPCALFTLHGGYSKKGQLRQTLQFRIFCLDTGSTTANIIVLWVTEMVKTKSCQDLKLMPKMATFWQEKKKNFAIKAESRMVFCRVFPLSIIVEHFILIYCMGKGSFYPFGKA